MVSLMRHVIWWVFEFCKKNAENRLNKRNLHTNKNVYKYRKYLTIVVSVLHVQTRTKVHDNRKHHNRLKIEYTFIFSFHCCNSFDYATDHLITMFSGMHYRVVFLPSLFMSSLFLPPWRETPENNVYLKRNFKDQQCCCTFKNACIFLRKRFFKLLKLHHIKQSKK